MNFEQLQSAYRRMCLIRAFESRVNDLFVQGIVTGTTHLCIGQEACAVGTCLGLTADDVVFSNHRGHGHLLARGADPSRVMAELFGSPRGYAGGRGGSQHIAIRDLNFLGTHGITAGTIPLAVGAALHLKVRRQPGLAVVFFGDGALGEGVVHESFNMAALWHLRVLFVCENNQYAMSSPFRHFSPVAHVAERAAAYGFPGRTVDGNDVETVAGAVTEARQAILDRPQPHLLELVTYRVAGHSRGDPCLYRTREEEQAWARRDPLLRTRGRLAEMGGWSGEQETALQAAVAAEVAAAEAFAREGAGGVTAHA